MPLAQFLDTLLLEQRVIVQLIPVMCQLTAKLAFS